MSSFGLGECLCKLWQLKGVDPVTVGDVKLWLRKHPIRNELAHFSCIMDPSVEGGGLVWVGLVDCVSLALLIITMIISIWLSDLL